GAAVVCFLRDRSQTSEVTYSRREGFEMLKSTTVPRAEHTAILRGKTQADDVDTLVGIEKTDRFWIRFSLVAWYPNDNDLCNPCNRELTLGIGRCFLVDEEELHRRFGTVVRCRRGFSTGYPFSFITP